MTAIVVGFAGAIGSGKSTISAAIADARGWPRVSFGDFVRAEARERGLDETSREVLQAVGESLIADGWDSFCATVIRQAGWEPGGSLVIDGIRHAMAVTTMRRLVAPTPFALILLQAADRTRQARLQRAGRDAEWQGRHEMHSTEVEVATLLPDLADVSVDADRPITEVIASVHAWLVHRQRVFDK